MASPTRVDQSANIPSAQVCQATDYQVSVVEIVGCGGANDGDAAHSGAIGGRDADNGVLEDYTALRRHTEPFATAYEYFRIRLAVNDIGATDDRLEE